MSTGLLKFITCGSVDDGKSTLIGNMLYNAKLLYADQERALELDSQVGNRERKIDYSLLLDGLMAEREQGITIDVAYRYFTTDRRSFIVADTPGHEEYTRNMAVGASFASLAVILVDAAKGILVQTRRHARICALMGIKYFVFAVNKMDLIEYSEKAFQAIEKDIRVLAVELELPHVYILPVSATEGDNITMPSSSMPWYKGSTLFSYLENVDVEEEEEEGFVMPVQRVCRADHAFRGFQGQIESGYIKVGDEIEVLPSREHALVKQILVTDTEVSEAAKGNAVTIQLDKEVDVSRGCVFHKDAGLIVSHLFTATMLWMDEDPLVEGHSFYCKIGTKTVLSTVMGIKYKIDVNSGAHIPAERVHKNELVYCDISLAQKSVFDKFDRHRALGEFILIDRITNMTSACGIVEHSLRRADNITWHDMEITRALRTGHMGQEPVTLWFTGLSGSGKSTLANETEKRLFEMGKYTMLLDGDNVRMGINRDLGFTKRDRVENIRRVAETAKLMNDAGLIVLASFISPYAQDREMAKGIIGEDSFIEIYVSTPLDECEKRDVKGLYRKARKGDIPNFTGINSPYEPPENPGIVIDTTAISVEEAVQRILKMVINEPI